MKQALRLSLRARLMALVIATLAPAFALIVYQATDDQKRAVADAETAALRLMRQAAQHHEQLIDLAYHFVTNLARAPDGILRDAVTCHNLIADSVNRQPKFASVFVLEVAGAAICGAEPGRPAANFADRPWFREALNGGRFVASEYLVGRVSTQPIVVFAAPMLAGDGTVRAVVAASLQLEWINQAIEASELPPGSSFTIVDANGIVLARQPEPEKWIGKPDPRTYLAGVFSERRREAVVEAIGVDGVPRIYAATILGESKNLRSWRLSIGMPRDAVYGPIRETLAQNLFLMSAVAVLVLATAWFGSGRLVVRPVRSLVETATRWGAGDLSARTLMAARQDEIGQLAVAFDRMAESLQSREAGRNRADRTRAQLGAIVESSSDAIASRTHDGIVTSWNKGAEDLFGYSAEEMIGQSVMRLIPEAEMQKVAENFSRIRRGERIETYETVRLKKGGVPIDVSVTVSPVIDRAGEVIGACFITRDVSGRKQAENEIKALHDINLAITSSLDLPTVLKILLEKIDVLLPYAASHIRLTDKATGRLGPVACHNIDEEEWKAGASGFRHGVHGTILALKRPLVIPDLQNDDRVPRREFYRRHGLVSYLGVPLIVQDEAIGVLSLLTKEMHAFTLREIRFAENLAKQASVAIFNSQLYERAKRLSEELTGSEEHIRGLLNGLIHARDEEAKRIARTLHDESGQLLAMVYIALDELAGEISPADRSRVQNIKSLLDDVEKRLRDLSHELHPAMLDHLGLLPSIEYLAAQVAKRTGIEIKVSAALNERLSPVLELSLFRVAQEAFNNAAKHAAAKRIDVRLVQDENLIQCAIQDDGAGFHPAAGRGRRHPPAGLGLAGMRERIEEIGGTFQIVSAPGEGTKLFITVPKEKHHGPPSVAG